MPIFIVRMPSIKDKFAWKRISGKLKSLGRYFKKAEENIYVLTPLAIPLFKRHGKIIQKINKYLLIVQLSLIIKWLDFKRPVLWVCLPSIKDVALYLKKKLASPLIYYCVDNISYYPGADQKEIFSYEMEIQKNANLCLFVNHQLVEERKIYNPNTFYIPHGVDYDHFSKCLESGLSIPDDIKNVSRPIAGYVGAIREIDFELVKFLAEKNKNISFVFIGDILAELPDCELLENIHFLGKKSYEILPNYIQMFSCCCMFYKTDDKFNYYRNPKKLNEYLATGKPVVSVNILEAKYYRDYVYVAKNYDEYNQYLNQAIFEDSDENKRKRVEYARTYTWDSVALKASEYIAKNTPL
jgi:hypothetical protein